MAAPDDHALAARLAHDAGQQLLELRDGHRDRRGSWWLEKAGDALAHKLIVGELRRQRPGDAVLSEEGLDDLRRLDAESVWIVDPLDGSSDFAWADTWAVHIGLTEGGEPTAGAVALPVWDVTFATEPPALTPDRRAGRPRVAVSRSLARADGLPPAKALHAEIVVLGSAGFKAMTVVCGHTDAYVTSGWLGEWDLCAPAAVALAAGLHASRLDGSRLRFNEPRPWLTGGVICRPELAEEIIAAFA